MDYKFLHSERSKIQSVFASSSKSHFRSLQVALNLYAGNQCLNGPEGTPNQDLPNPRVWPTSKAMQAQTLKPHIVYSVHGHIQRAISQRPCTLSIATIATNIAQTKSTINVAATILQHCKLCLDLRSFSRRRSHVSQCVCGARFEEERRGSACDCSCWG